MHMHNNNSYVPEGTRLEDVVSSNTSNNKASESEKDFFSDEFEDFESDDSSEESADLAKKSQKSKKDKTFKSLSEMDVNLSDCSEKPVIVLKAKGFTRTLALKTVSEDGNITEKPILKLSDTFEKEGQKEFVLSPINENVKVFKLCVGVKIKSKESPENKVKRMSNLKVRFALDEPKNMCQTVFVELYSNGWKKPKTKPEPGDLNRKGHHFVDFDND